MHISDPNAFTSTSPVSALKKRKRDGVGSGHGAWNQENSPVQEGIPYQLDIQDINMLAPPRFTIDPPAPSLTPPISPTQRQWLHLQTATGGMSVSDIQKKRKILQPHSHNQHHQQQLRPHSGSPAVTASAAAAVTTNPQTQPKKCPPALMIPFFNNNQDPEFSSSLSVPDEYEAISPRTTTMSINREASALPPPLLRPCHVCHRKPSTKVMLDAYADCDLCGERACYICLRECNSANCQGNNSTLRQGQGIAITTSIDECVNNMEMTHYDNDSNVRREVGYLQAQDRSLSGNGTRPRRKMCSMCAIEGLTDTGEEIVWCVDCVRREEMNQQR